LLTAKSELAKTVVRLLAAMPVIVQRSHGVPLLGGVSKTTSWVLELVKLRVFPKVMDMSGYETPIPTVHTGAVLNPTVWVVGPDLTTNLNF